MDLTACPPLDCFERKQILFVPVMGWHCLPFMQWPSIGKLKGALVHFVGTLLILPSYFCRHFDG